MTNKNPAKMRVGTTIASIHPKLKHLDLKFDKEADDKKIKEVTDNTVKEYTESLSNLKEDLEKHPEKYLKNVMKKLNDTSRALLLKEAQFKTLEKRSLMTVADLQKELDNKDKEIKDLKSFLSQIRFLASSVESNNERG